MGQAHWADAAVLCRQSPTWTGLATWTSHVCRQSPDWTSRASWMQLCHVDKLCSVGEAQGRRAPSLASTPQTPPGAGPPCTGPGRGCWWTCRFPAVRGPGCGGVALPLASVGGQCECVLLPALPPHLWPRLQVCPPCTHTPSVPAPRSLTAPCWAHCLHSQPSPVPSARHGCKLCGQERGTGQDGSGRERLLLHRLLPLLPCPGSPLGPYADPAPVGLGYYLNDFRDETWKRPRKSRRASCLYLLCEEACPVPGL